MNDKLLREVRVFLNEVAQRDMYGSYRLIASDLMDDILEQQHNNFLVTKDWPEWLKYGPVECRVWDHEDEQKVKTIVVAWQRTMHGEHEIETFLSYGPPGPQEWLHADPITHTS
jgi:hypothetical protein